MIELGKTFADSEVAGLYRYRPGYPSETFAILARLIVEPRSVLDVGCGRGELARELVRYATRIDAVDPSVVMIDAGRELPGGSDARLRWIVGRAEDAPLSPPYGLITCGSSLHWLDPAIVLPRFRAALAPAARIAVATVDARRPDGTVGEEVLRLIQRYSPCYRPTERVLNELVASGTFVVEDTAHTEPRPITQSVEDYLRELSSTATLSRVTLGGRYQSFVDAFREIFARQGLTSVERTVEAWVAWGRPS